MDNKLLILNALKAGASNATTRTELSMLTGLKDRNVRELISELVNDGNPIVTNTKIGGYYYPDSIQEAEQNITMLDNYIRNLAIRKRNVMKWQQQNHTKSSQICLEL